MNTSQHDAVRFGERIPILSPNGPVSFGLVVSGSMVSWSNPQARDLLIGRIWSGIHLYPADRLESDEPDRMPPILVCSNYCTPTMGIPADWNGDGQEDLIVSDRHGFLYLFERKGAYPNLSFEYVETISDRRTGLPLNIPHDNPYHMTGNQGGYVDPQFFNYVYPMVYPNARGPKVDLIVGDKAGVLWWLPDESDDGKKPAYTGEVYDKNYEHDGLDEHARSKVGKAYLEKYGNRYIRPPSKICDENGEPFLLGEGLEAGFRYPGSHTRPVLFRNPATGTDDLLVLAGFVSPKIYYLQRSGGEAGEKPVFRNLGEVAVEGLDEAKLKMGPHSRLIVDHATNDLILSAGNLLWRLKNKREEAPVPRYRCLGPISGNHAATSGYHYAEVLEDRGNGKRYVADCQWTCIELREIMAGPDGVYLSTEKRMLEDQHGVFRMQGETDPQSSPDSGFHQIAKWDFDGSGRQHLIAGSDKGLLYLLVDEGEAGIGGTFEYRSVGPLADSDGLVIKVHNRACPAGADLDGDGREDLIVCGATYQLGFHTDPNPGAGVYYLLNKGMDADGKPILERGGVLPIGDPILLQYTGKIVPDMGLLKRLLDLDGDGKLELVYAGGEPGIAFYRKMITDVSL